MINRSRLFGIAFDCPFSSREITCPLVHIDDHNLHEKYKLIDAMEESGLNKILMHHQQCLVKRDDHLFERNSINVMSGIKHPPRHY
ncbi:hypothetical protein [Marinilabilia rubra]|uniref:Uncharacterized protein n=1 Tax=Marinilabilia rubra TaxID=2162893 RepID=A0A2U2B7D7_9BACT|nr:hypothetical protein [Marinilabilia rubra]PWD98953.1 hypothetical protein DDZ16_13230 [Marinilabilia rubra]